MSEASRDFPDPDAIFGRALCLAALAIRGLGECSVANGEAPAGGVHGPLHEFIAALELNDELTAVERRLIEAPLGSLTNFDLAQFIGLEDALRTLVWALGVVDQLGSHLMPPEQSFEAFQIINGLAADPPSAWKLRDRREIARAQRVEDVALSHRRRGAAGEPARRAPRPNGGGRCAMPRRPDTST